MVNDLFSFPLFLQIVSSGVIMSSSAFEIFAVKNYFSIKFATRIQFTAYTILELLIFSHAAENIQMESSQIGERIYKGRWYDLKMSIKKHYSLMSVSIQRAAQSVKISAMGFSDISYDTFVNVRKFSFAFELN